MSDIYSGVQFRNNGKLKLLIIVGIVNKMVWRKEI